jgi:hypothetical protein
MWIFPLSSADGDIESQQIKSNMKTIIIIIEIKIKRTFVVFKMDEEYFFSIPPSIFSYISDLTG